MGEAADDMEEDAYAWEYESVWCETHHIHYLETGYGCPKCEDEITGTAPGK